MAPTVLPSTTFEIAPASVRRQVNLGGGKTTQVHGRPGHAYQDKSEQEEGEGTINHRGDCDDGSDNADHLSQCQPQSPSNPLHGETPDHRPAGLSHHQDPARHPGHSLFSTQVNADQGVDGKGGDEAGGAEALGQEEYDRNLPGDAVVILHLECALGSNVYGLLPKSVLCFDKLSMNGKVT
jgi:hypothetical protein